MDTHPRILVVIAAFVTVPMVPSWVSAKETWVRVMSHDKKGLGSLS
jgi:hypothetical protein